MAAGIVAATVIVFVGLLAVVSPFYRSFDESKYLGIGYSMLAGHGPRTVFGAVFLPHSPLWPMIVTAPNVWFGIDAFDWGHANAIVPLPEEGAVLVFSPAGQLLATIGAQELKKPRAVALEPSGAVLVYDEKLQRILRFK